MLDEIHINTYVRIQMTVNDCHFSYTLPEKYNSTAGPPSTPFATRRITIESIYILDTYNWTADPNIRMCATINMWYVHEKSAKNCPLLPARRYHIRHPLDSDGCDWKTDDSPRTRQIMMHKLWCRSFDSLQTNVVIDWLLFGGSASECIFFLRRFKIRHWWHFFWKWRQHEMADFLRWASDCCAKRWLSWLFWNLILLLLLYILYRLCPLLAALQLQPLAAMSILCWDELPESLPCYIFDFSMIQALDPTQKHKHLPLSVFQKISIPL